MKLENKIIVVAGGTGEVGEGIVKFLLAEGGKVIVPFRTESKANYLRDYLSTSEASNLTLIKAEIGDFAQAQSFKMQVLEKFGRIDIAIASLGGWYQGYDLADWPYELWMTLMNNNLNSHFSFARTFLPVLRDQKEGLYVNINGGAQDMLIPQAGGMTIISSAQTRMTEVMASEAEGKGYQVCSVAAFTPVKTRARGNQVQPDWVSAEDLGRYISLIYQGQIKNDQVIHKLYKPDF